MFILEDGSLAALQRGGAPFDQSDVSIFAFDGHMYRESRRYVVERNLVDEVAPRTTATVSPLGNEAGWIASPATLTLSATDDNAVQLIRYQVVGTAGAEDRLSRLDSIPIKIAEGRWLVRYHAIDIYGNEEAGQEIEILVDETAPLSRVVLEGVMGEDGKFLSPVVVSLLAADPDLSDGAPGFGVSRIEYSLDGGTTWLEYSEPVTVTGAGTHEVLHRAVDLAGNIEVEGQSVFEIVMDAVAPTLAIGVRPNRLWPPNGRVVSVGVTIDASDEDSGLARITIRVEDEYHMHEPPIQAMELTGEHVVHRQIEVPLIASRLGSDKNGRLYHIVVEVMDVAGNLSSAAVEVLVPHDQGQGLEKK